MFVVASLLSRRGVLVHINWLTLVNSEKKSDQCALSLWSWDLTHEHIWGILHDAFVFSPSSRSRQWGFVNRSTSLRKTEVLCTTGKNLCAAGKIFPTQSCAVGKIFLIETWWVVCFIRVMNYSCDELFMYLGPVQRTLLEPTMVHCSNHMCNITSHDTLTFVTCVICGHESFICVGWLIHMCDTTHSCTYSSLIHLLLSPCIRQRPTHLALQINQSWHIWVSPIMN